MNNYIMQIAERIRGLRLSTDTTIEQMAAVCGTTVEDYAAHEDGKIDFSFSFIHKCAKYFGVDITEILTGDMPTLSFYNVVKHDEGLSIKRREGFHYQYLAPLFRGKVSEPFFVTAIYNEELEKKEIELSTHIGQEFDYIIEGSLKVRLEDHIEYLNEGDCIYYDSSHGHGMIAVGGKDCRFLAIVMEKNDEK